MKQEAIIVLSHLMDQNGKLLKESKARADKAAELKLEHDCPLVLIGWNYRPDTKICIADAMADYLTQAHGLNASDFLIDRNSRDTVGDAVFSRYQFFRSSTAPHLAVVTSDYHADRTARIFEFVYGSQSRVSVFGVKAEAAEATVAHEQESLLRFGETFKGVEPGNLDQIINCLSRRHPFYNGDVYPQIDWLSKLTDANNPDKVDS